MKKLLVLIGIIILACACIFVFRGANKNNTMVGEDTESKDGILQQDENVANNEILLRKYFANYAWGFYYNGKAIFSDGSIYEWNISSSNNNEKVNTNDMEWILKNGTKLDETVSNEDLEKIKSNIDNLKDNIEVENVAMDAGRNYIVAYKNGEEIVLIESGDFEGENTTKESQQLLEIAEDYLGKILFY